MRQKKRLEKGDTIICRDAKDAHRYANALISEGYLWECAYDFKRDKYIITILGNKEDKDG